MKATSTIIQEREKVPAIERGTLFFHPNSPEEIFFCYYICRVINRIRGTIVYSSVAPKNVGSTVEFDITSVVPFNGEITLTQSW